MSPNTPTPDPDAALLEALPSAEWMNDYHPLEYGTPGTIDHMLRCPTCEEWSPCRVRTMYVAALAATGTGPTPDAALREAATQSLRDAWERYGNAVDGAGSVQSPAVRDLVSALYHWFEAGACGPHFIKGYQTALAATASPGLDVERLARAHNNVMFRRGEGHGLSMEHWAEVAREYAALAADREESDIDPNAEWNTPS